MFSQVKEMAQNTANSKRTAEEASLTTESVTKKSKVSKGPYMPHEFDTTDIVISIKKNRAGELLPEVKIAGQEESKFVAQFNTPMLSVQFNDLKQGGDTGKFGKDETNYNYNVKTIKGLPDKVASVCVLEEKRQEAFWTWVESTSKDILAKAFETKGCMENHKKKAQKAAKKNKTEALTEFVNGATVSMLKEYTDTDGDDHPMFVCKRRGQYKNENGEYTDNRPVFWRLSSKGFEKIDIKYLPQGSVIKYQIGFRVYSTPNMYGVSCDLGKNIVVVYKEKTNTKQASTAPVVPCIDW